MRLFLSIFLTFSFASFVVLTSYAGNTFSSTVPNFYEIEEEQKIKTVEVQEVNEKEIIILSLEKISTQVCLSDDQIILEIITPPPEQSLV